MRGIRNLVALFILVTLIAEFVGCAGDASSPKPRKKSGNTTAAKK